MDFLIAIAALVLLMFVAYRGFSVILFAPVCAMLAVLLTDPAAVPPMFTGVFMEKMVGFVKLYFPVFLLGAVFGKVIELSGFSKSIVASVIQLIGRERAMLSIVVVCAVLTYGGVSLFVVVFAVYPFAAEMFKQGGIPKRLIPGTIALGAFTFTMDSLPGTPQIQNIIPTTFFKTDTWAAPWLGVIGAVFILVVGLTYLEWRRKSAQAKGEGYGEGHINEPEVAAVEKLPNPFIALLPLVMVGVMNWVFVTAIPNFYGKSFEVKLAGMAKPLVTAVPGIQAIWAVEGALLLGILTVLIFAFRPISKKFAEGSKADRRFAVSFHEHRFGVRVRRSHRLAARFRDHRQRTQGDPRSAGQRSDYGHRARGDHRLGLRRYEHRAGCHVRNVHPGRKLGGDSARGAAPGGFDGERRHGYPAAQRRGHHAADGHRADA